MPRHPAPSTRPVRPRHPLCEALSIATHDGLCGLDVPAAPTDDETAEEEEEEEVQVEEERSAQVAKTPRRKTKSSELLLTLANPATRRSRSTGHGAISRTVRGADGATEAEAEASSTELGQADLSPLWPLTTSS